MGHWGGGGGGGGGGGELKNQWAEMLLRQKSIPVYC